MSSGARRVAITGSHGMIGRALMQELQRRGDAVTRIVRSFKDVSARERVVVWHPAKAQIEAAKLEGHDAVIHLAGESLMGVWTPGKKRAIRESRVKGTDLLARTLAGLGNKPSVLVCASGITYYGTDADARPLDESNPPGTGFLAETSVAWERAADPARGAGIRVVHTRFASILSPEGGMLRVLLPFFRLGLGPKFGTGEQIWPWVALDDVVRAILFVIDHQEVDGAVNVAAPEAVSNAQFAEAIAAAVQRPSILRIPAFALDIAPGGMAEQILLAGQRISSEKLRQAGFVFQHPELQPALRTMLRRD